MTGQKSSFFNKWQGNKECESKDEEAEEKNQPTAKHGPYMDPDANKFL